jgi:molybdenum cofactor guanylyltransferase
MTATIERHDITACILAGGRGTRMGGVDKGLQPFLGQPLALHSLQRIAPQVGALSINANRNLDTYRSFGATVFADQVDDFSGPLAGFLMGLAHCTTPYLLTLPCDTPLFPHDLAARLSAAFVNEALTDDKRIDIAMVSAPEQSSTGQWIQRSQPVFCLLRVGLRPSLQAFVDAGGRKIDTWTAQHRCALVAFDDGLAFSNANSLAELAQLAGDS